jgi:hypothetical protein
MSDVISFRADEATADEIAREMEAEPDDPSRSQVTKRLLEEAVEAREKPLWVRIGMSDRRAAQIEALRKEGETEEDLARELFTEALEARDEDVLDAIGASDELREAVEERREEGESLDGAVERLLRAGVESDPPEPDLKERAVIGAAIAGIGLMFVAAYLRYGIIAPGLVAVAVVLYISAYPTIDAAATRALDVVRGVRG